MSPGWLQDLGILITTTSALLAWTWGHIPGVPSPELSDTLEKARSQSLAYFQSPAIRIPPFFLLTNIKGEPCESGTVLELDRYEERDNLKSEQTHDREYILKWLILRLFTIFACLFFWMNFASNLSHLIKYPTRSLIGKHWHSILTQGIL